MESKIKGIDALNVIGGLCSILLLLGSAHITTTYIQPVLLSVHYFGLNQTLENDIRAIEIDRYSARFSNGETKDLTSFPRFFSWMLPVIVMFVPLTWALSYAIDAIRKRKQHHSDP